MVKAIGTFSSNIKYFSSIRKKLMPIAASYFLFRVKSLQNFVLQNLLLKSKKILDIKNRTAVAESRTGYHGVTFDGDYVICLLTYTSLTLVIFYLKMIIFTHFLPFLNNYRFSWLFFFLKFIFITTCASLQKYLKLFSEFRKFSNLSIKLRALPIKILFERKEMNNESINFLHFVRHHYLIRYIHFVGEDFFSR